MLTPTGLTPRGRQSQSEPAAMSLAGANRHASADQHAKPPHECKAEAGPSGGPVQSLKRLKNTGFHGRWNTRAGIPDLDDRRALAGSAGDQNAAMFSEFHGIVDQVAQRRFQQDRIGFGLGKPADFSQRQVPGLCPRLEFRHQPVGYRVQIAIPRGYLDGSTVQHGQFLQSGHHPLY